MSVTEHLIYYHILSKDVICLETGETSLQCVRQLNLWKYKCQYNEAGSKTKMALDLIYIIADLCEKGVKLSHAMGRFFNPCICI